MLARPCTPAGPLNLQPVTRRILQVLPDRDLRLRARWLSWLGITLAQTGRPAEALTAQQQAVAIRRELAAASPDRYRPDLATSLQALARALEALGRPEEAKAARREADLTS
jgi:tetratricopeptide (TPR) repeat protein